MNVPYPDNFVQSEADQLTAMTYELNLLNTGCMTLEDLEIRKVSLLLELKFNECMINWFILKGMSHESKINQFT